MNDRRAPKRLRNPGIVRIAIQVLGEIAATLLLCSGASLGSALDDCHQTSRDVLLAEVAQLETRFTGIFDLDIGDHEIPSIRRIVDIRKAILKIDSNVQPLADWKAGCHRLCTVYLNSTKSGTTEHVEFAETNLETAKNESYRFNSDVESAIIAVDFLYDIAEARAARKRWASREQAINEMRAVSETIAKKDTASHRRLLRLIDLLEAETAFTRGDVGKAVDHLNNAISLLDSEVNDNCDVTRVARCVYRFAAKSYALGAHTHSIPFLSRVVKRIEELSAKDARGISSEFLARCLFSRGMHFRGKGDYVSSKRDVSNATEILTTLARVRPLLRTDLVLYQKQLSELLCVTYQLDEAIKYALSAIELALEDVRDFGESPRQLRNLSAAKFSLAFALWEKGRYQESLDAYDEGISILEKCGGEQVVEQRQLISVLIELSSKYASIHDLERSLHFAAKARLHSESLCSLDDTIASRTDLVRSKISLAGTAAQLADYDIAISEAKSALDDAQSIKSKGGKLNSVYYIVLHRILADTFREKGELDTALDYAKQSVAESMETYGASNPNGHMHISLSKSMEALILAQKGDHDLAKEQAFNALKMSRVLFLERVYPNGHTALLSTLYNSAFVYGCCGNSEAAWAFLQEYNEKATSLAISSLSQLRASDVRGLRMLRPSKILVAIWRASGAPAGELYEMFWKRQGLVLDVLSRRWEVTPSPESDRIKNDLAKVRSQLAGQLRNLEANSGLSEKLAPTIEGLRREKERLERELLPYQPRLALSKSEKTPQHSDLSAVLAAHQCFVEFVLALVVEPKTNKKEFEYLAFVVLKDRPVECISLGRAEQIEDLVRQARKSVLQDALDPQPLAQLRDAVWRPLESIWGTQVNEVYICPDSALCYVPWICLPAPDQQGVLLERYTISNIPSGQLLLKSLQQPNPSTNFSRRLLAGDIDFDSMPVTQPDTKATLVASARNTPLARVAYAPLPGSRSELEMAALSRENAEIQVFSGAQATVSAISAALPTADLAHFATHGYFADSAVKSLLQYPRDINERRRLNFNTPVSAAARNPMLLSGLVLAGANRYLEIEVDGSSDGGVLTAETISLMPLSKLRLAVLSACDTGLGETAGNEGTMGLERAFHLAGTTNVISSLWKVDDRATSTLMSLFYHQLLVQKKSPVHALRSAQLTMWQHPEYIEKYDELRGRIDFSAVVTAKDVPPRRTPNSSSNRFMHPRLWAAFHLSGPGR